MYESLCFNYGNLSQSNNPVQKRIAAASSTTTLDSLSAIRVFEVGFQSSEWSGAFVIPVTNDASDIDDTR